MNKTSMLYWYPLTKDLDIPHPKTEIVLQKPAHAWFPILEVGFSNKDIRLLECAAKRIGYPLFIRTDHCSSKHQFLNTCYVKKPDNLYRNIHNLLEDNYCKDLYPEALIFREYITLDSQFKAFQGLPIAPERRYFISDGEVVCHHPYWPEDAIEFYNQRPAPINYQRLLERMNMEWDDEIALLKGYAQEIASVLDGEFSVDFAKGKDGKWYFIDAATAIQSWHPEETERSRF